MDIYITFYSIFPKKRFYIYNGFSFGRNKDEKYTDLFFSNLTTPEEIKSSIEKYSPNKVWCSLSLFDHFEKVKNLINDKWIVGGPLVGKRFFEKYKHTKNFVTQPLEIYLNKNISSDFDFYPKDFLKNFSNSKITYSCGLGFGCYWRKCTFCSYQTMSKSKVGRKLVLRDVDKVLETLPNSEDNFLTFHTCLDSIPSSILSKLLDNNKVKSMWTFMRPDRRNLEVVRNTGRDLRDFSFSIGLEGFSQKALQELNKGFTIEEAIEAIKVLLKKNASVYVSVLGCLPFMDKDMFEESLRNISVLKNLQGRLILVYVENIFWQSLEAASKYAFEVIKTNTEEFVVKIPKNSDVFHYNGKIKEEVFSSFPRLVGSVEFARDKCLAT